MTTATTIRIRNAAETGAFIEKTSLAGCVSVDGNNVVRNWPVLSSGEVLLWNTLAWLNGERQFHPPLGDLRAGLDSANYAVVAEVLRSAA